MWGNAISIADSTRTFLTPFLQTCAVENLGNFDFGLVSYPFQNDILVVDEINNLMFEVLWRKWRAKWWLSTDENVSLIEP